MSPDMKRFPRRSFLKLSLVTVASLAYGKFLGNDPQPPSAQSPVSKIPQNQPVPPEKPQASAEVNEPSLLDTVKETLVVNLGIGILEQTAKKVGLPILTEKKGRPQGFVNQPVNSLVDAAVIAPPVEETLFRLIPNLLLHDKSKSGRWEIGIPASLVFGYIHNIGYNRDTNNFELKREFPLSQFCFGVYFWKLMRERGYWHAVISHSTGNAEAILLRLMLHRLFPSAGYDQDPR